MFRQQEIGKVFVCGVAICAQVHNICRIALTTLDNPNKTPRAYWRLVDCFAGRLVDTVNNQVVAHCQKQRRVVVVHVLAADDVVLYW